MLKIEGKTFMNIQEAVQWLLENNALPFQCTANYAGNTEIGMGTIVNPSPAKVRIGSLIFFADSKVSTVVSITENGFICSDQYNNLVDDIAYVTSVSINASGHLITTLSDGQTIDAGIIKQVSSFSINASQQLVANFNDGTSQNLGSIFSGNVNIAGNLTANSIIENMVGYSYASPTDATTTIAYAGVVKNGNKITFVVSGTLTTTAETSISTVLSLGRFTIPSAIGAKLFPNFDTNRIGPRRLFLGIGSYSGIDEMSFVTKWTDSLIQPYMSMSQALPAGTYHFRYEETFLLSDNLAS